MEIAVPEEEDDFYLDTYLGTHLSEYDGYIGKHLLLSLTYLRDTGEVRYKVQLHGIITRINEAIIAVERQDTGELFTNISSLVPGLSALILTRSRYLPGCATRTR